jgi:predicted secreted protein
MFTLPIPGALAFAVFLTIWFTVLFAILPIGVRSQAEVGEVVPGSEPGAPSAPRLWMKAGLTTLVSIVVFVVLVMILRVLG